MIADVEIILYVKDQEAAKHFYSKTLKQEPTLHVPGMTEFDLAGHVKLGLMPNEGIAKIISPVLPHPSSCNAPRCELYLMVDDPVVYAQRAFTAGAKPVSAYQARDWGHSVVYVADADHHVIAFAKKS